MLAFHDAYTDTDTDTDTDILVDILARIVARMSVSVSASWNSIHIVQLLVTWSEPDEDGVDELVVVQTDEHLERFVEQEQTSTTDGDHDVGLAQRQTGHAGRLEQTGEMQRPLALSVLHDRPLHLQFSRHAIGLYVGNCLA